MAGQTKHLVACCAVFGAFPAQRQTCRLAATCKPLWNSHSSMNPVSCNVQVPCMLCNGKVEGSRLAAGASILTFSTLCVATWMTL